MSAKVCVIDHLRDLEFLDISCISSGTSPNLQSNKTTREEHEHEHEHKELTKTITLTVTESNGRISGICLNR